jgi:hypothetical protein
MAEFPEITKSTQNKLKLVLNGLFKRFLSIFVPSVTSNKAPKNAQNVNICFLTICKRSTFDPALNWLSPPILQLYPTMPENADDKTI